MGNLPTKLPVKSTLLTNTSGECVHFLGNKQRY